MRLNPKIRRALQAIETARAELVAMLREVGNQIEAGKARATRNRSRACRAPKPVAKKKLA
jgi:hypothetical protein